MTAPAILLRRKRNRDYHARRELTGERKVTVWLSTQARAKLASDAAVLGTSKDAAAERAIMDLDAEKTEKGANK